MSYQEPGYGEPAPPRRVGPLIGWGAAFVVTMVGVVVGIWQVDEQVYSPGATAEQYGGAIEDGEGPAALGFFADLPAEDEGGGTEEEESSAPDSVLLSGDALSHSSDQMKNLHVSGDSAERPAQELAFDVDGEEYTSPLSLTHVGNTWALFDTWRVDPSALTEVELTVPGATAGGIGQVEVNGEPVNLNDGVATLSAFTPTVADISVDSDWLSGSAREVIVADDSTEDAPAEVTMELEASDAATEQLHTEVEEFLTGCAEQEVLMPSGCPMGTSTDNRVDADTISWTMPDASDVGLTFGEDGWEVSGEELSAEVEFESEDSFDGTDLNESTTVDFQLDIEVGASGDDLIIVVSGN